MGNPFHIAADFAVSPKQLYAAFNNVWMLRNWLCDYAFINRFQGNHYLFTWNNGYAASGHYTTLQSPDKLEFTWHSEGDPGVTIVSIAITGQDENAHIELTHSGFGVDEVWQIVAERSARGWHEGFDNLTYYLRTGLDQRVMRRPMLGVTIGLLDDEAVTRLGLPTREGVFLGSVIEGLGAQASGLQNGDLLISLGGHILKDFGDLAGAVSDKKGGDTVEVIFYRGADRQTVQMRLSERPMPPLTDSIEMLAGYLKEVDAELTAEMDVLLANVSDEDSVRRPTPDSWSVNENLAHLIFTERFNQTVVFGILGGDDHFSWPDNNYAQLSPFLNLYPDKSALVDGLKREMAASVAQLAALPADTINNRPLFVALSQQWQGNADHFREHLRQMGEALESLKAETSPA